jgi:hypothetical protein
MPTPKPFRKLHVNKASRAELAAWDPHDIVSPTEFPILGRDVPYKIGPDGHPVMALETRVQAYGEAGIFHETKCPSCGRWLMYKMCDDCLRLLRFGLDFDRLCLCRRESFVLWVDCDDHKRVEDLVK